MKNINLFTSSVEAASIVAKQFKVINLFTDKKLDKIDLLKLCRKKKIKFIYVKNHSDLQKHSTSNIDLGIIFAFGIIFKKKYINNYKYGLWNIHPGDLPKYRGRHPITYAFLNDEKKIGLTVHKIDANIDQGYLLAKGYVDRSLKDDENSIKKKLFTKLPNLLKKAYKNFQQKKIYKIGKGKYYKPLYKGINIKKPNQHSYKYIYNAIKAQKAYGGI